MPAITSPPSSDPIPVAASQEADAIDDSSDSELDRLEKRPLPGSPEAPSSKRRKPDDEPAPRRSARSNPSSSRLDVCLGLDQRQAIAENQRLLTEQRKEEERKQAKKAKRKARKGKKKAEAKKEALALKAAAEEDKEKDFEKHNIRVFVSDREYTYGLQTDKFGNPALDKNGKQKKKLQLDTSSKIPSEMVAQLELALSDYQKHLFTARYQASQNVILKVALPLDGCELAADFAENFSTTHRVEVQSEYWNNGHVTLFIIITRRWAVHTGTGEQQLFTQAHVFVSPDRTHDSHFVQHCYKQLVAYFDAPTVAPLPGFEFVTIKRFYIETDGAPGHFKSRFSLFSLLEIFKKRKSMWSFCAPGHGKGPWDGLAAVIKTLLRRFERHGDCYMATAADVFIQLEKHYSTWTKDATLEFGMDSFLFWYVPLPKETQIAPGSKPTLTTPIVRPKYPPEVTKIPGIRYEYFCFRPGTNGTMYCRAFTCYCEFCLEEKWNSCKNTDAGEWHSLPMTKTAGQDPAADKRPTRNDFEQRHNARTKLARTSPPGAFVALQSAEDPDRAWWLASVTKEAFCWKEESSCVNGLDMVRNGWYLEVQHYDHSYSLGIDTYQKSGEVPATINADGVIRVFDTTHSLCTDPPPPTQPPRPLHAVSIIYYTETHIFDQSTQPSVNSNQ